MTYYDIFAQSIQAAADLEDAMLRVQAMFLATDAEMRDAKEIALSLFDTGIADHTLPATVARILATTKTPDFRADRFLRPIVGRGAEGVTPGGIRWRG